MELLDKLGETKLKWPKGLRKFIYNQTNYLSTNRCCTYYVDTLEVWRGKLLMRSFAYKVPKADRPYKMQIQEVCRRLEGEKEILLCQIENKAMGGRNVHYTESGEWVTNKDSGCYYTWYKGDKKSWWFYEHEMYDINEWIKRLNIPYCAYDKLKQKINMPFFQYVELYKKYPKVELLVKSGWGQLVTGVRYFNFKGKSFEQIFKIPKYWKDYMDQFDVSDILFIRKYKPASMAELNIIKNAKHYHNNHVLKYINKKVINYIENYNRCEGFPMHEYNDYLRMAESLGYSMDHNDVLCPKDGVIVAHNKMQDEIEIKESIGLNEGIEKNANKLMKYKYENEKFIIIPAKSCQELIKESKVLNHCVRTYAKRVSEGQTGILFIRKKDEIETPFVTLELCGSRVTQARAENNHVPSKEVKEFIAKWEKRYKLAGY